MREQNATLADWSCIPAFTDPVTWPLDAYNQTMQAQSDGPSFDEPPEEEPRTEEPSTESLSPKLTNAQTHQQAPICAFPQHC